MGRLRLVFVAGLTLALASGRSAARQQPDPPFTDLLRMYRVGDADRAVAIVAGWDDRRLDREVTIPWPGTDPWDSAAQLLLLEEAGVRTNHMWSSSRDRRMKIAAEIDRQAEATRDDRLKTFHRDVGLAAWLGVPEIYEEFRDRFPDDPLVQVALGAQMEYEAPLVDSQLQNEYSTYRSGDVAHVTSHGRLSWKADQAIERLRHALKLDPQMLEAHLRLGRVLWLLDRTDEAEREWIGVQRWGSAATDGRNEVYLAGLFLGRLYEERRDPARAEAAYRAAIALRPSGQSARLAVAHMQMRIDPTARGSVADALVTTPLGTDPDLDPWTMYLSQQRGDQTRARLAALRVRFRR